MNPPLATGLTVAPQAFGAIKSGNQWSVAVAKQSEAALDVSEKGGPPTTTFVV